MLFTEKILNLIKLSLILIHVEKEEIELGVR